MHEWYVRLPSRSPEAPHFGGAARRRLAKHRPVLFDAGAKELSLVPRAIPAADVDPALGAPTLPGQGMLAGSALAHPVLAHPSLDPNPGTAVAADDEPPPTTEELIRLSRLRNGRLSRDELGKLRRSLG